MDSIILKYRLDDEQFGSPTVRGAVFKLEDAIESALPPATASYDGNQIGDGWCTFYMYGGNADAIYEFLRTVLSGTALPSGSQIILRYASGVERTISV